MAGAATSSNPVLPLFRTLAPAAAKRRNPTRRLTLVRQGQAARCPSTASTSTQSTDSTARHPARRLQRSLVTFQRPRKTSKPATALPCAQPHLPLYAPTVSRPPDTDLELQPRRPRFISAQRDPRDPRLAPARPERPRASRHTTLLLPASLALQNKHPSAIEPFLHMSDN